MTVANVRVGYQIVTSAFPRQEGSVCLADSLPASGGNRLDVSDTNQPMCRNFDTNGDSPAVRRWK